ncbi:MAG: protein kinase, partial [Chloroflexi bacterium]|nr:protein kinase [Chloroflexota bacterium]
MTIQRPGRADAPEAVRVADRYWLLESIGEGGAAEVYRAWDQRLERVVAIKILRPQLVADRDARQRFANEAKAAAAFAHPNTVPVYDYGDAPDGSLYIAMQLIAGPTLKDVLVAHGRLAPRIAISIARQICAALSVAHGKGLIHRDVKPQNVLLDPDGVVRLTDFGIVKALSDSTSITAAGTGFGTAAYLSPEQASGQPVGPASDVYSLGIVLYEMLAGRPPFTGDNTATVAYQQVWEAPQALAVTTPHVSGELDALVMQALAKRPAGRPRSAVAFADALAATDVASGASQAETAAAMAALVGRTASTWSGAPAVARTGQSAAAQTRPTVMADELPAAERTARYAQPAPPPADEQAARYAQPAPPPA